MNKVVYKGIYKSPDQLGAGVLPDNAVKFKEPETPQELNKKAVLFMFPLIFTIVAIGVIRVMVQPDVGGYGGFGLLGVFLSLVFIVPHEYLHAMAFPKGTEVELWVIPKQMVAFVYSPVPMTKWRFIFLSALPSLVLGIAPLLIWAIVPLPVDIAKHLYSFGAVSLLMGSGDLMNIYNAATQMPKGSIQQLHGFNSYWYSK